MRGSCLRLDDPAWFDPRAPLTQARSWKMAQITGYVDNQAEDAIAEVFDQPLGKLPIVNVHGSPRAVVDYPADSPVTTGAYDVPLEAFSFGGQFFLFCSSNSYPSGPSNGKVMGRSILTRAVDPTMQIDPNAQGRSLDFQYLTTLSDYRFIFVSAQLMSARSVPGFESGGDLLLVWGTGAYRADDLRLAILDLGDRGTQAGLFGPTWFPTTQLALHYFAGMTEGTPRWSRQEDDALPLLWPEALGEISVRYVPEIDRYLLMAMSGPEDRMGTSVWLRTSPTPWGPWSRRRQVFDWYNDGMGVRDRAEQFIHNDAWRPPDTVGDGFQGGVSGGAYAPFLHDIRLTPTAVVLRYALSTWNPYQVMLMEHVVSLDDLRMLEV
jgi:Domain of unknown function (DUF4185)